MSEEYTLTNDEIAIVNKLTKSDIEKIDNWLLANTSNEWKKVALVVAKAISLSDEKDELTDVPDIFFGMRIEKLVADGKLQSQGNLKQMRKSEIKRAY